MEHYRIQDYDVSFDPENHRYRVDGKPVPSITQIISEILPVKRKKIDPAILKKAADRGNELRAMIENYETRGHKTYHPEMQGYLALKTQHQFDVLETGTLILLHHHGVIIAAGRFNMIVESPYIKGQGIADVKRRLHLDEERLMLQLNLYKLGYEQTYKRKIHYLKCLHIRNRYHRYIDIPENKQAALDLIGKYLDKHPLDYHEWL